MLSATLLLTTFGIAETAEPGDAAESPEAAEPVVPASGEPICLWAAGRNVVAYPLPPDFLERLSRDVHPDSSRSLRLYPDPDVVQPESLALPRPVISATLPNAATQILLPTGSDARTLVLTRAGVVSVDRQQPQAKSGLYLTGRDLAQGARAADGIIYLLERPSVEDFSGAAPASLVSWKGGDDPPDTIAACTRGSQGLLLAPGDSVIWVTRPTGRAVDRAVRRGAHWERQSVDLVQPQSDGEERWSVGIPLADPPNRCLFVSQRRGGQPNLLEVLPDGTSRTIFTWSRGLRAINGALAVDRRLLTLNGSSSYSILDLDSFREWSVAVPLPVTTVATTPDGAWVATAAISRDRATSQVLLRHRGSARTAVATVEGLVLALAIQIGD